MTKVREMIEIEKWVDGLGWHYDGCISNQTIEVSGDTPEEIRERFDWSWWDVQDLPEGEDLWVVVSYYNLATDDLIAMFETLQSDLIEGEDDV